MEINETHPPQPSPLSLRDSPWSILVDSDGGGRITGLEKYGIKIFLSLIHINIYGGDWSLWSTSHPLPLQCFSPRRRRASFYMEEDKRRRGESVDIGLPWCARIVPIPSSGSRVCILQLLRIRRRRSVMNIWYFWHGRGMQQKRRRKLKPNDP